jgi:glycosyltransferase involved in cell wall biosynthesis
MERLAERFGVSDIVRFLGRVDGIEKYRLMASAHAVLMPSRFETFGMVAIESQATGSPVVAFDVGPLADVAGGGGALLVPAFDTDAFAERVAECVTNHALACALRAQGRTWARQYDWDVIAAQQGSAYLRAASQRRAHRLLDEGADQPARAIPQEPRPAAGSVAVTGFQVDD